MSSGATCAVVLVVLIFAAVVGMRCVTLMFAAAFVLKPQFNHGIRGV